MLGDFWSYNREFDSFVVSPEPDVSVHQLDGGVHRCIIVASDGIWNMVSAAEAVEFVERFLHQRRKLLALVSTSLLMTAMWLVYQPIADGLGSRFPRQILQNSTALFVKFCGSIIPHTLHSAAVGTLTAVQSTV